MEKVNCMPPLSPSAQKVQDALASLGYDCTVNESTISTRTAADAAELVGCHVGQIVKSLIFIGGGTGKAILVLTSGANRVDEKLIGSYSGEKIVRADPEFVRNVTGYAIGGVPPLGHLKPMESYIDEDLLQFGEIWAAAGTPHSLFKLTPLELQNMTGGRVVKVKN
jgi:prolyl-tRNA editing enzyme YbaK/EbsC (Cys-tRNA(Pro) deacylase)